jgi:hypothetical protein
VSRASTHEEANEVAWKFSLLEDEPTVARQARDTAEVKLPGLVDRAANADRNGMRPRGSANPGRGAYSSVGHGVRVVLDHSREPAAMPLHEGMQFAATYHTKMAKWLATL